MEIEVKMRIPAVTMPSADGPDIRTDHSDVRFTKRMTVPAMPQPGSSLEVTTRSGMTMPCTVTGADWHEARAVFVVFCRYAKRGMPADVYQALTRDPDWTKKALVEGL